MYKSTRICTYRTYVWPRIFCCDANELLELPEREVIGMRLEHLFDELLVLFVDSLLMKGAVASPRRESLVVGPLA